MKHLLTAIACCFAVAGSAQTPVAYNPDVNGDNFVGSADLVALLAEYGSDYVPLFYDNEAHYVPYINGHFIINELAPIYIIDARLDTLSGTGTGASIIMYEEPNAQPLLPLNGSEFWMISSQNNLTVHLNVSVLDETCGYIIQEDYDFYIDGYVGNVTFSSYNCDGHDYMESDPLLSKMIFLDGEFLLMR